METPGRNNGENQLHKKAGIIVDNFQKKMLEQSKDSGDKEPLLLSMVDGYISIQAEQAILENKLKDMEDKLNSLNATEENLKGILDKDKPENEDDASDEGENISSQRYAELEEKYLALKDAFEEGNEKLASVLDKVEEIAPGSVEYFKQMVFRLNLQAGNTNPDNN